MTIDSKVDKIFRSKIGSITQHFLHRLCAKIERPFVPTHKKSLGKIQSFRHVAVTPYQYLMKRPLGLPEHQGGPIWPDWHNEIDARFCRNRSAVDDLPDHPQSISKQIQEPAAWCGPIVDHFGHQVADFSTRILHTRSAYPDAKLLFGVEAGRQSLDLHETPALFRSILDWLCVETNDIEIITHPTLVHELLVAPQAEQLTNYGPAPAYLDLLDELTERQLKGKRKQGILFVSRAGMPVRFAGEEYIEHLMAENGVRVIRPETMTLREQLAAYAASECLIFTQGSALHGLQLLGRSLHNLHVLPRYPGYQFAKNLLNVRAKSLKYFEVCRGVIYGLEPGGNPGKWYGISVFEEDAIIDYLRMINPTIANCWNQALYLEHRDKDVISWFNWLSLRSPPPGLDSLAVIINNLREHGLEHLTPTAERVLKQ